MALLLFDDYRCKLCNGFTENAKPMENGKRILHFLRHKGVFRLQFLVVTSGENSGVEIAREPVDVITNRI
jgi:hypothetical protein